MNSCFIVKQPVATHSHSALYPQQQPSQNNVVENPFAVAPKVQSTVSTEYFIYITRPLIISISTFFLYSIRLQHHTAFMALIHSRRIRLARHPVNSKLLIIIISMRVIRTSSKRHQHLQRTMDINHKDNRPSISSTATDIQPHLHLRVLQLQGPFKVTQIQLNKISLMETINFKVSDI